MTLEQYKKLQEAGAHEALWLELLNASGFAGVLPNGKIVDRRYFHEAAPVEKNSIFGTSKPKVIRVNKGNPNHKHTTKIKKAP